MSNTALTPFDSFKIYFILIVKKTCITVNRPYNTCIEAISADENIEMTTKAKATKTTKATTSKAVAKRAPKAKAAPKPTFADLANKAHADANGAATTALNFAFDAGEVLTNAKTDIDHGGWEGWCNENLTFSFRTAAVYMKLFANKELIQNSSAAADSEVPLSVRAALNAIPKSKRTKKVKVEINDTPINPVIDLTVAIANYMDMNGETDSAKVAAMTEQVFKLINGDSGVVVDVEVVDITDAEIVEAELIEAK